MIVGGEETTRKRKEDKFVDKVSETMTTATTR